MRHRSSFSGLRSSVTTASLLGLAAACSSAPPPAQPTVASTPPGPIESAAPAIGSGAPSASPSGAPTAEPVAKGPRKKCSKTAAMSMEGATFWKSLVAPGACWALQNYNGGKANPDDTIVVEGYEARHVGDAEVAKLRYTRVTADGETSASEREHLPLQVAVTKSGIWFVGAKLDEQAIGKELKKPPTYSDPPRDVKPTSANKWQFVRQAKTAKGPVWCFGHEQPRGPSCEDTCTGMVCVSSTAGVVLLEGTASPSFETFMQPGWEWSP